jgi:hypothetical protein
MTQSIDLTAIPGFKADSPAAVHHPVPLEDVTWAMVVVFAAVVALAGLGVFAVLRWLVL